MNFGPGVKPTYLLVTLSNFPNLSEPQVPYLQSKENTS